MQKDDTLYLGHMLDMARKAVARVEGKSRESYDSDEDLSPHFSPAVCCGVASTCADFVILARRSSTYRTDTPPVSSLAFLAITGNCDTSRQRLVRKAG